MNAFINHLNFEFKTGLRNRSLLLMNYLFPLGFYFAMGLVMTQINPEFRQIIIPAMIGLAAMTNALLGLPGPMVEARDAGIYRSYKINGIPAANILLIPSVTSMLHFLIVSLIITFTAGPFFHGVLPVHWGAFTALTLLTGFVYSGIGTLIGVIAKNSRATILLSQAVFLPSMLIGGMMVSLQALPASIRPVSSLLPASHIMQAYTGLAFGGQTVYPPVTSILILSAGGILAYTAAALSFHRDNKKLPALLVFLPFIAALPLT